MKHYINQSIYCYTQNSTKKQKTQSNPSTHFTSKYGGVCKSIAPQYGRRKPLNKKQNKQTNKQKLTHGEEMKAVEMMKVQSYEVPSRQLQARGRM